MAVTRAEEQALPSDMFDDVVRIARTAKDARGAWEAFVRYLEARAAPSSLGALRRTDLDDDVARVRRQLERLVQREPPMRAPKKRA